MAPGHMCTHRTEQTKPLRSHDEHDERDRANETQVHDTSGWYEVQAEIPHASDQITSAFPCSLSSIACLNIVENCQARG